MPPPPLPPVVAPPWSAIQQAMHLTLPADYREFIDCYGDGEINHVLSVFFPARQRGPRPTLTVLLDNTRSLRESGFFDDLDAACPNPAAGRLTSDNLLLWGQTSNGCLLFWATDGEDPDTWPIRVHFQDSESRDHWVDFDGGMVDFLVSLGNGGSSQTNRLIGDPRGAMRWSRLRDWKYDYGRPPAAVFDDRVRLDSDRSVEGRRASHGSFVPLRKYGQHGGDQAHWWRTGQERPLIELEEAGTSIRLSGGSQPPGIVYSLNGTADLSADGELETIGVQLLCDGYAIDTALVETGRPRQAELAAEVCVPAEGPGASIQLRVVARGRDDVVIVNRVHLQAKGTLGTEVPARPAPSLDF
ncbi:hypothetical protein GCM10027167_71440 [Nocardia heshunensis]